LQCAERRRLIPPIVLLPALTQYVWFVAGASLLSFTVFVPALHSLQYLLIAWSMQLREKLDRGRITPSPRYVASESLRFGLINFLGGAALFYALPQLMAELAAVNLYAATGIVIAGVQIHHFFVDGVIWKLKSKAVSSPLMGSFSELVRPAPAAIEERAA
jgi:hypothetical protein